MKKEDLLAIAKEAAKDIKTEHDLNTLTSTGSSLASCFKDFDIN